MDIEVFVISLLLGIPIVFCGRWIYRRYFDPMRDMYKRLDALTANRDKRIVALHTQDGKVKFTTAEVMNAFPSYSPKEMTGAFHYMSPSTSSDQREKYVPTIEAIDKYLDEVLETPPKSFQNWTLIDDGLGVLEDTETLPEVDRIDVLIRQPENNIPSPEQKEQPKSNEQKEQPKLGRFESIIE